MSLHPGAIQERKKNPAIKRCAETVISRINSAEGGSKVSINKECQALAEEQGLSAASIRQAVYRLKKVRERSHGNHLFTIKQEVHLVALSRVAEERGSPLTIHQVCLIESWDRVAHIHVLS